jgi:23S rRNA (uracil1939-C5)-methyltransferase
VTTEPVEVEIARLGAQGDGIAEMQPQPLYVPFALPGERWRLANGGSNVLLRPDPARSKAICSHFGSCGGCVAQHMPEDVYVAWKRAMIIDAFRHRGIIAPVGPLYRVSVASRRRVTLYARRDGKTISFGFHRRGTHHIVDIAECPIAVPRIVAALPALRDMVGPILSGRMEATVHVLATQEGLDVHLTFTKTAHLRQEYSRLAGLAARYGFARLTVERDTLLQARSPSLDFDGVAVVPPPAGFVQAVAEAEQEMIRCVVAAVGNAKRIADLFCGIGTFALPLARFAQVLAIDSREDAVGALGAAARHIQGRKPIEAKVRDLFRTPLGFKELEGFDAIVLDPPAQGAKAQVDQIARSLVRTVIYVSCDPGTLARDARILLDAGYNLESIAPIDQFLYSAHLEAVVVFRR